MKADPIQQYVTARKALLEEKARIEARLQNITGALGGSVSTPAPIAVPAAPAPQGVEAARRGRPPGSKRQMSAAGRARLSALAKRRWAKIKAAGGRKLAAAK